MVPTMLQPEVEVEAEVIDQIPEVEEEVEMMLETSFLKVRLHKVEVEEEEEAEEVAVVAVVEEKLEVKEKPKEPHSKELVHQDKIIEDKLMRPHSNGGSSMKKDQLTIRSQLMLTPLSRNFLQLLILSENLLKMISIKK
jgi:cobalamin biosynthesis protein CobT